MSPMAPTMARTSAAVSDTSRRPAVQRIQGRRAKGLRLIDGFDHRGRVDASGDGCLEAPKPSLGVLQTLFNGRPTWVASLRGHQRRHSSVEVVRIEELAEPSVDWPEDGHLRQVDSLRVAGGAGEPGTSVR